MDRHDDFTVLVLDRRGNLFSIKIYAFSMMDMFNNGKMKSMPPKLLSDDGRNIVIRPLTYCREKDIAAFADSQKYPIIPCNLCGSQENLQRKIVKSMLVEWDEKTPGRIENIFNSTRNVSPSQLADGELFNFNELNIDRSSPRAEYEHTGPEVAYSNLIDLSVTYQ